MERQSRSNWVGKTAAFELGQHGITVNQLPQAYAD